MARKQPPPEEFNPWPPFVDVFASVIMVLLFFMMITVVNVAYFSQFQVKSTLEHNDTTQDIKPPKVPERIASTAIVVPTDKPPPPIPEQRRLFEGGDDFGGAVQRTEDDLVFEDQRFNREEMVVVFESNEVFVGRVIFDEVLATVRAQLAQNPDARVRLFVSDSTQVVSKTRARQISLARVLDLRNKLQDFDDLQDRVEVQYRRENGPDLTFEYGYIHVSIE
jgi:hypothetical protein